jgi:hypothetical protein
MKLKIKQFLNKKIKILILATNLIIMCFILLPKGYCADPVQCIKFKSDNNGNSYYMQNQCNVKLTVRWFDEGSCRNGCSNVNVRANTKSYMTPPIGHIRFAACIYPQLPNYQWRGNPNERYSCN